MTGMRQNTIGQDRKFDQGGGKPPLGHSKNNFMFTTKEQQKLKEEFLEKASLRFSEDQAQFLWTYIMETMIAMDQMRHGNSFKEKE